jgi:hypothetical protein
MDQILYFTKLTCRPYPFTRVQVKSRLDAGGGMTVVELLELEPLDPILAWTAPNPTVHTIPSHNVHVLLPT